MHISTSEFRTGLKIEIDDVPYKIIGLVHVQQKRRAVLKTKIKNILTGSITERSFMTGDKVDMPDLEEKDMEYLYQDGHTFYFMDTETYEQTGVDETVIEDVVPYLTENIKVVVQFYNGKVIAVELPQFLEVEVKETEPGIKGDTVNSSFKPAKVANGGRVDVPLFINTGDFIKIKTADFSYVERVKM